MESQKDWLAERKGSVNVTDHLSEDYDGPNILSNLVGASVPKLQIMKSFFISFSTVYHLGNWMRYVEHGRCNPLMKTILFVLMIIILISS